MLPKHNDITQVCKLATIVQIYARQYWACWNVTMTDTKWTAMDNKPVQYLFFFFQVFYKILAKINKPNRQIIIHIINTNKKTKTKKQNKNPKAHSINNDLIFWSNVDHKTVTCVTIQSTYCDTSQSWTQQTEGSRPEWYISQACYKAEVYHYGPKPSKRSSQNYESRFG